ncbi:MAG: Hsp20/alpha crystallin family protein [Burkholderiales bacterium]|nr:Hsp20/alpha crystallin family protein [Burkholderiales bacterium]
MILVPMGRHASEFSRSIERLFDDRFLDRVAVPACAETASRAPAIDVRETERGYVVNADLPGVAKEDVKVQIEGRRVNLSAEVRQGSEQREGERLLHRERSVSTFSRSFALPAEIDQAASAARLDHGVLTLTLVKRSAGNATQLEVH